MKQLVAAIMLLALMKASYGRTPSPLFTCSDSSNVVLVVDRSQSVAGSFPAIQSAVNNFITEISNNNLNINVGLVYYDNDVVQQLPLTPDVNALLSFVAFQSASNFGTRTDLAIRAAVNMLQASGLPPTSGSIIVVTDGISQLPTETALRAAEARNALYTLFAVGINGNSFAQELYDITRDESQVTELTDISQLSTVMTNIARSLCAYTVCNGCAVDGGTRITEHPTRCDKFYLCERRPEEQMKAYEKVCPIGSLFHRRERTCKPSRSILRDPTSGCSNCAGTQQSFPVGDYCEIYYTCGVIESEAILNVNCCPTFQRYDINLGACTPDNTCQRQRYEDKASCRNYYSCDGPSTTFISTCCNSDYYDPISQQCTADTNCKGSCNDSVYHRCGEFQQNPANKCTFFQQSGTSLIQKDCPGGTSFSETECRCVHDSSCAATTTPCEPDVNITVTPTQTNSWGFSETGPNKNWIDVKLVQYQGGAIRLTGRDSFISVPYYATNDQAFVENTAFFRINVKDDLIGGLSANTQEMVVLSNLPCPGSKSEAGIQPSVFITMRPSTGQVIFGVRTLTGEATVSVNYFPANTDDWKELTMRYTQSPGLLEGRVILYSYDAFNNRIFNGQEFSGTNSTASGRILTSDCAMKLGSGSNTDISFAGLIDNVAFYTCNSGVPAVNAVNTPV